MDVEEKLRLMAYGSIAENKEHDMYFLQSELAALKAENERLRSEKAELLASLQSLGASTDRLVAALQQEQGQG